MSCCGGNCGCGAGCKCGSGCGGGKMCPDITVETARTDCTVETAGTEALIVGVAPQKEHFDGAEGSAGAENGCKCNPCNCNPCNCK